MASTSKLRQKKIVKPYNLQFFIEFNEKQKALQFDFFNLENCLKNEIVSFFTRSFCFIYRGRNWIGRFFNVSDFLKMKRMICLLKETLLSTLQTFFLKLTLYIRSFFFSETIWVVHLWFLKVNQYLFIELKPYTNVNLFLPSYFYFYPRELVLLMEGIFWTIAIYLYKISYVGVKNEI